MINFSKLRKKKLNPTIINDNSNFVVITYWWGRGNKNKNTQRPCPEDLEEGQKLRREPITYDQMISEWETSCQNHNCNYMAVEYPEFVQKGAYQKAINFKPLFILEALKACAPRNVLYIDGDMHIKRFPRIFEWADVDYMAQGWNSDPRYRMVWDNYICYYPYVFETSGGTMFFSQSRKAKFILKEWYKSVKQYPKKAEDRLISQIFNQQKMLLDTTTVQLPIEYLWLSLDYDHLEKNFWSRRKIFITHPACLTGEDRAFAGGAAADRYPPRYTYQMTDQVKCRLRNQLFYEYIFYPGKKDVSTMSEYLKVMQELKLLKVVNYDKRYGSQNSVADKNTKMMKSIQFKKVSGTIHICVNECNLRNTHILSSLKELLPTILGYLSLGNTVIFVPAKAHSLKKLKEVARKDRDLQLICRNKNKQRLRYKTDFTLSINRDYPMLFRPNSEILKHLLTMSKTLADMSKHFNSAFVFPSRIRCNFL